MSPIWLSQNYMRMNLCTAAKDGKLKSCSAFETICARSRPRKTFFLAKTRGCVPGAFTTLTGHETRQLFLKLICDGSMKVFFLNLIKDTSWSTWNLKTQELSTTSQPNLNTEQQPCSHTVPAIKTCLCKWLEMMYKVLSFGLGAPRDTKTLGTFSFFKTMQ